jgi:hypothetical protein
MAESKKREKREEEKKKSGEEEERKKSRGGDSPFQAIFNHHFFKISCSLRCRVSSKQKKK